MKYRLKLAALLTPGIFLPILWVYPVSLAAGNHDLWSGVAWALLLSFTASYSIAMFAHALVGKDSK